MNSKRYSSLLFGLLALSLILFGMPLTASAYHSGSGSDLAANPELVTFRNYGTASVDKLALKDDTGRWSAFSFYHGQYVAMLRGAEADSARWVAMGDKLALNPELAIIRSYSVSGSPVLKVDSVRWSALGHYYAQSRAMLRGAEADSGRWVAMGDKLIARGRDADSARWVAMATFYGLEVARAPQPEFDPYRSALDLYYSNLASNPELLSLERYETCGC